MTDPQLDDTSADDIRRKDLFRKELRDVFGVFHWVISTLAQGHLYAVRVGMPDDFDQAAVSRIIKPNGEVTYTVSFGPIQGSSLQLKQAAERARRDVTSALSALQSVNWKVEP